MEGETWREKGGGGDTGVGRGGRHRGRERGERHRGREKGRERGRDKHPTYHCRPETIQEI